MTTLLIALAGGLGAGARFSVDRWLRRRFDWSTHVINLTGSFALGLLIAVSDTNTWHMILGIGFLGGYTTFSAASLEAAQLVSARRYATAAVHALSMLLLSVAAAACGYWLG